MSDTHITAATQFIETDGARFAYRRWGKPSGVPLVFIQHFRGEFQYHIDHKRCMVTVPGYSTAPSVPERRAA